MLANKPVGRDAASRKYDILTALGAYALIADKGTLKLTLRIMTLITARYNWRRGELSMGRREIARLWSVDERTVKRELAKLKALGWLEVKYAGARGRVTVYAINFDRLLEATQPVWASVGPDFVQRMGAQSEPEETGGDVVPFTGGVRSVAPDISDGSLWSLAAAVLHNQSAAAYGAWFRPLQEKGRAGGNLVLTAPSSFHAHYVQTHYYDLLLSVLQNLDASVHSLQITSG